ncbi:MAG: nucleotidyltransferase domain-containing protein [Candidatus Pacearchaeota archaeon]
MLTKNQTEMLDMFRKNIFLNESIRKIALVLNKPYPKVYEALKKFEKEKIVQIKKVGSSNICSLMLNKESIAIFSMLDKQEAFSKKIPNIDKILSFNEFLDDILIVSGSYAKGCQTKKSDIDIVIITKEDAYKKQELMENMAMTFLPEFHITAFSYKNFINMLLNNEFNLGKETFRFHLIFRNPERYYELIKEAIKNGFKG